MRATEYHDFKTDEDVFELRFNTLDMVECPLDNFDRALLHECNKSKKVSDKLLALETIVRRLEESH